MNRGNGGFGQKYIIEAHGTTLICEMYMVNMQEFVMGKLEKCFSKNIDSLSINGLTK